MVTDVLFVAVGGLGLFMYGMTLMSEGLKKVAGQKLKNVLKSMTKHRLVAFFVGAGITALIQSSSAATVMVVGFVNAGLLTLKQAISVIIGTNVGTTATAWLVSISGLGVFKITDYALPVVAVGFAMQVFAKRQNTKNLGQIILGFGILFIGIGFMKDAFAPLENNLRVQEILISLGNKPILAILAGTIITMMLQSSSASIAMIQVLAFNGAFGTDYSLVLPIVIPFMLGDNIGTTITAQIASFRTNRNARRAAWAHTMFNVIGASIWFWFIPLIAFTVYAIAPWEPGPTTIAAYIALSHTMIKVLDSIVLLPMVGVLEKLALLIVKDRPEDQQISPVTLERHLLETPSIAMDQVRSETVRMAHAAKEALNLAVRGLQQDDHKKLAKAGTVEDSIDDFQFEITAYLSQLATKELSQELSTMLPVLLHTVNDLERVGDHAVNIAEIAERKIEKKITFTDAAKDETKQLKIEVNQMIDRVTLALENNNTEIATTALENEDHLNRMQMDFRRNHVNRMIAAECTPQAGLIFIDLVDNMEKIGDHLKNIAQAVIGGLQWAGSEPAKVT